MKLKILLMASPLYQMRSKIPLQGAELDEYLAKEKAEKEKAAAEEAALARTQLMLEADEDQESESDESDDEDAVEHELDDEMDTAEDGVDEYGEPIPQRHRRGRKKETDIGDWALETEDGGTKQMLSYDIYLKGNVSKTTSFFKSAGTQQQRFRMFPYVERRRRVDQYGEVVDVGMWLRKGKVFEEEAESDESKEAKRQKELEEEVKVCLTHSCL